MGGGDRPSAGGQHLDVSLYDATAWTTAETWPAVLGGVGEPARRGNRHPERAPEGLYRGRDGALFVIEVDDDDGWLGLLAAMKREDLAGDPRYRTRAARRERAEEVDRLVAEWAQARSVEDVVAACQAHRVAAAPVLSLGEVAEHAHTRAREMVIVREHPVLGPIRLLGTPLGLTRPRPRVRRPAPALGADSAEVLGSLR